MLQQHNTQRSAYRNNGGDKGAGVSRRQQAVVVRTASTRREVIDAVPLILPYGHLGTLQVGLQAEVGVIVAAERDARR